MWKRIGIVSIFIAIFALGLLMRSPEIISGNYLFGFDQGQNYMRAYDIAVNHKFTLIGAEVGSGSAGVPGLFHGPGFYYLLAVMLTLFGGDPYGGLVLMWIGGVFTLILAYSTGRTMFGRYVALFIFFLVSIAPLIAPQSRFVWGPHLASVLIVAYLYFLYKIPEKPNVYVPAAAFTAGMLYHFELALSVPLLLLVGVAIGVYRVFRVRVVISFVLACVLAFSPMILFEIRHGFTAVNGILTNITQSKPETSGSDNRTHSSGNQFRLPQKNQQFVSNFRDSFVFEYGLIPASRYNPVLVLLAVCIITGIAYLADKKTKRYAGLLAFSIPVTYVVFLPLKGNIWPYYLIHLHFVYIYLLAIATVLIFRSILKRKMTWLIPGLFLVFFYLSVFQGAIRRVEMNWKVDYRDYGGKDKIVGKKAAIDYIYADAKGTPFNVLVFMPPVYTWPYDYLFLTYAKKRYGYSPGTEKKGTVYLIIEMDGQKPWTYKGWLETVVKDGVVVWEKYLTKSDQIIQKRIIN